MCRMMSSIALASTGREKFDDVFDAFERREIARAIFRSYIAGINADVDREIALRLHIDRIGDQAVNADILETLARSDLREIESLYGTRVRLAAARGRQQGNYSALRCFVREVRRARRDLIRVATAYTA